jgi:hypothetical protein
MYGVYIEMPSGAKSQAHEDADQDLIKKIFDHFVCQMKTWKDFSADVIMLDGKIEIAREKIGNAER